MGLFGFFLGFFQWVCLGFFGVSLMRVWCAPDCSFLLSGIWGSGVRYSCVTSGRSVVSTWQGITGQVPTVEEWVAAVAGHDLFVYCGHGSGESLYPNTMSLSGYISRM